MAQYIFRSRDVLIIFSFALLLPLKTVQLDEATLSPVEIVRDGENSDTCPLDETLQSALDDLQQDIRKALESILPVTVLASVDPCGPGVWLRAAYINMSDPQQHCPSGWTEFTTSGIRACGRSTSCSGSMFVTGRQYSKVCGRVTAYQKSSTDAFYGQFGSAIDDTLDGAYVDGVSVTHGSPRNHIWTFAAGWSESSAPNIDALNCPCSDSPDTIPPPSFVGNNYFCEAANTDNMHRSNHVYTNDTLWDGLQCENEGTCCTDMSPPWFSVELPIATADSIEVRICGDESLSNENVLIELLEIYVQ